MAKRKGKNRAILRRYCHWIANPQYARCPGEFEKDVICNGCESVTNTEANMGWRWPVVPPVVPEHSDEPRYFYDEDGMLRVSKDFKYDPS